MFYDLNYADEYIYRTKNHRCHCTLTICKAEPSSEFLSISGSDSRFVQARFLTFILHRYTRNQSSAGQIPRSSVRPHTTVS